MIPFTGQDFAQLALAAFSRDYSGYRPKVIEIPNGDGRADRTKHYAHIALKYSPPPILEAAFWRAFAIAQDFSSTIKLAPKECALRVLRYPPGAGSEYHTDFDLFTVNLWRSHPGLIRPTPDYLHFGELWPLLVDSQQPATGHWVDAHPTENQYSLVFFALPARSVVLPNWDTVGQWLDERMARSRAYRDD